MEYRDLFFKGVMRAEEAFHDLVRPLAPASPRYPRGIWYSELFAFWLWARHYGAKTVVESGIHLGQSTEALARLGLRVVAVDRVVAPEVRQRLERWPLVTVVQGEAAQTLGAIWSALPAEPWALLLDGPKGAPAVELIEQALAQRPACSFGALHDTYRLVPPNINSVRDELDRRGFTWSTDDPSFVAEYRGLDGDHHAAWLDETGGGKMPYVWRHGGVEYPMVSYGPTLTFVWRKP